MSIVVYGASGFTGTLVARALREFGVGEVLLGGRDGKKLEALSAETGYEHRVAEVGRPDQLRELLRGAKVLISTAGPFLKYGDPMVSAALEAGAHFLDTTGEQAYMNKISERYHGSAQTKQLAVINAQAFEFALGYCASAILAEAEPELDSIDLYYRVKSGASGEQRGASASRGTLKSAVLALAEPGYIRRGGALVERGPSPLPKRARYLSEDKLAYAIPFPGGESLHLPREYPHIKNVSTNLVVPRKLALPLMTGWSFKSAYAGLYRRGWLSWLERRIDGLGEGPSDSLRKNQRFSVMAHGYRRGPLGSAVSGSERRVVVSGVDPYGITGAIAALGGKLLLEGPPKRYGVISTDQAFGAEAFLTELPPQQVSWVGPS